MARFAHLVAAEWSGDRDFRAFGGSALDALLAGESAAAAAESWELALYLAGERGQALLDGGRFAEAQRAVEDALARGVGERSRLPTLHLIAAYAAQALGQTARADEALRRCEEVLAELGSQWDYAVPMALTLLTAQARVARELGRPDDAAARLTRALELAVGQGDPDAVQSLDLEFANLWLLTQRLGNLERHVAAARGRSKSARGRAALELCLATGYLLEGRADAAYDARARELLERLRADGELAPGDLALVHLRLAELELRARNLAAARLELDRATQQLPDPLGFERVLARMLHLRHGRLAALSLPEAASHGALAEVLVQAREAFREWLAASRDDPLREDGTGLLHVGERRGLAAEYLSLLVHVEGPAAAAAALAELQALASFHRRADRTAPAAIDARTLGLGDLDGVLCYFPSIGETHLFAIDKRGVAHFELPPVGALAPLRAPFVVALDPRAPDAAGLRTSGPALRAALLPDRVLAHIAEWKAVSITGLDLLRYVPFEALPLADGRTFGSRFATAYLPDLVTAAWLTSRAIPPRPAAAPEVAWIGASIASGNEGAIALVDEDRRRLGAGAGRVLAFEGETATPQNLALAANSGASVLHVVAHGVPLEDGRIGTGLLLADGAGGRAVLGPEFFRGLERVPPLVILSACRAGRGAGRLGEAGLDGLVGAFLERGASCVVLAFEDVELSAALELLAPMQAAALSKDMAPREVLRLLHRSSASEVAHEARATLHAIGRMPALR
ncbi:MAG: CHAT domain-containing protein [Planctomycetaceae bacterium]|nr:CHAT domain-containing protein [Planctomycetaceae bacterium]